MENSSEGLTQALTHIKLENLAERLKAVEQSSPERKVFTSSFGKEDQCITHAIFSQGLDIEIVTLDTGRLFPETYTLWADTESRYGKKIHAYYPSHQDIESFVLEKGINGFYDSQATRKQCCHIRKVVPLGRALKDAKIWITGIRMAQTASRGEMTFAENDSGRNLIKVNPLLDWSDDDMERYIRAHDIPVNSLHAQNYPSIGCQPCTRAITAGEDPRAGRWWWENEDENQDQNQECGLHVGPDGRLVRKSAS
jgi:phosphoadenosine phosphosulfate reductase